MAKILFWNIAKKDLTEEIVALCKMHEIDILILAECQIDEAVLESALNADGTSQYRGLHNTLSSPYLFLFFNYPAECILPVIDEDRTAIRRVSPPAGTDFLLAALHLPSKLYRDDSSQLAKARRVSTLIREAETQTGHARTLVLGDFNMTPFDPGLVSADGFHAVMTKAIARRQSRRVDRIEFPFFYNPMWGLMGDASQGPPGTYYYSSGGYTNYFWHAFDQVLLRPDLLDFFTIAGLLVITEVGDKSLLSNQRISTQFSDHLPIMIRLTVEEG